MRTILRFACGLLLSLLAVTAFADSLTYDPVGNVATRTTLFGTTTYTYDAVNRITAESGPAGNFSYSYDANGSRLSDSGGSYTYSATSNRLTARHGHAVTTDAAGNITADGMGHTYVYNEEGYLSEARLNNVLLATYDYDFQGLRTRKTSTAAAPQGAQSVFYTYDEAGHLLEESTATGAPIRTYVWRDDTPIAQIDHVPTRRIRYFATDHLNTPRAAMDETGKVIWRWESDAFGSTPANEDPDGDGVKTTVNLRFPGQYYDQETGLHYNWQRYYHPGMGQYIQPDPVGLRGGSFSTYTYVGGNPLRRTDPTGLVVYIVGNVAQQTVLQNAYDNIGGRTERGAQLINTLETSSTVYTIVPSEAPNGSPAAYDPNTHTIYVKPGFPGSADSIVETTAGAQPSTIEAILGHEIGHAATGTLDNGFEKMNNVNQNENPIRKDLSCPSRTAY